VWPEQLVRVSSTSAARAVHSPRDHARGWRERALALAASPSAPVALVVVGIVLRAVRYFSDRSLWVDEAALALNLTTRSYSRLFGTLDFDQGAPIGFLMIEKAALGVFGDAEWALRLPSFVAGLVALAVFWLLAVRFLERAAALLALALFAVLEPFVYYSAELKQYGFDVLVAIALALLFDRAFERPTVRRIAVLGAAAVAGVWLSHPSAFVIAAGGVVLLVVLARRHERRTLAIASLGGAAALASFVTQYASSVRHLQHLGAAATAAAGSSSGSVVKNVYVIFSDPGELPRTLVGATAFLGAAGLIALGRRAPARAMLVVLTGCIAAVVAGLGSYPLAMRWELFLLPFAILLVSEGALALYAATRWPLRLVAAGLAAAVLAAPAVTSAKHLDDPPAFEPTKSLLADASRQWRPGDRLYVSVYSQYAFRYYLRCRDCNALAGVEARLWPFRDSTGLALGAAAIRPTTKAVVVGSPRTDLGAYVEDFRRFRGDRRVWLLLTHTWPVTLDSLEFQLDLLGRRLTGVRKGESGLFLYDFTAAGSVRGGHR
jgi:hypothetical protein